MSLDPFKSFSTLQYTHLSYQEQIAIRSCVLGLLQKDMALYDTGWQDLAQISTARIIGGLAYAAATLFKSLIEEQVIPTTNPEATGQFMYDLALLVDEEIGMPPDVLAETIEVCLDINQTETWHRILADPLQMMADLLNCYTCLVAFLAARQNITVERFLDAHLQHTTAPLVANAS